MITHKWEYVWRKIESQNKKSQVWASQVEGVNAQSRATVQGQLRGQALNTQGWALHSLPQQQHQVSRSLLHLTWSPGAVSIHPSQSSFSANSHICKTLGLRELVRVTHSTKSPHNKTYGPLFLLNEVFVATHPFAWECK